MNSTYRPVYKSGDYQPTLERRTQRQFTSAEKLRLLGAQMEAPTGRGWSLQRLRERMLKAAARVQRHARRLHVILERRAATLWRKLLGRRHQWRLAA